METNIVISSYGFMDHRGFGGRGKPLNDRVKAGENFKWSQISHLSCDRFGRMDLLSKYGLIAVEMMGLPALSKGKILDTPLVLGTGYGSLSVDIDFCRSLGEAGGGRPRLFSYTLPNIGLAEIALRHKMGGANLCVMAGPESGLVALWEGINLMKRGESSSCICMGADGVSTQARSLAEKIPFDLPENFCFAYAFLLEKESGENQIDPPLARLCMEKKREQPGGKAGWNGLLRLCDFLREDSSQDGQPLELCSPSVLGVEEVLIVRPCNR